MEPEALALTLPIRRLVEFLLRTGSIDSRFTGFDRALEGARLHRKLQRAAVKEYPDYQAEATLKQDYACAQITYTLEGRADGIFTDTDACRPLMRSKLQPCRPSSSPVSKVRSTGHRRRSMRPSTRGRTACPLCGCG